MRLIVLSKKLWIRYWEISQWNPSQQLLVTFLSLPRRVIHNLKGLKRAVSSFRIQSKTKVSKSTFSCYIRVGLSSDTPTFSLITNPLLTSSFGIMQTRRQVSTKPANLSMKSLIRNWATSQSSQVFKLTICFMNIYKLVMVTICRRKMPFVLVVKP